MSDPRLGCTQRKNQTFHVYQKITHFMIGLSLNIDLIKVKNKGEMQNEGLFSGKKIRV